MIRDKTPGNNVDVIDQPFLKSKKVNSLNDSTLEGVEEKNTKNILKTLFKSTRNTPAGVIENPALVSRYTRRKGVEKNPGENFPSLTPSEIAQKMVMSPQGVRRELNDRDLYRFLQYFWEEVSTDKFSPNWHVKYLCNELMQVAQRVARGEPKQYDLIVNVPPGTTKTITCSIMFPVWCWTQWPWMKFITGGYSARLSSESAEAARNLIRTEKFQMVYPELAIHEDKSAKSHYRIAVKVPTKPGKDPRLQWGGTRYSTSVGGTLTGFHGHILIIDDPINPTQAASERELAGANFWMDSTLPTRKVDKSITPTILIMQRLHQDDPTGHILDKKKENVRHISLPGEIIHYEKQVKPIELISRYVDGLLDPKRLSPAILADLEADLGQYSYAGQIGQDPTPPGGGMFKVDKFVMMTTQLNPANVVRTVRYWDKAGTRGGKGPFTAGVKMSVLRNGKFVIQDCRRGRWGTDDREKIIRQTAEEDGENVRVVVEQEPGSGGKESAEGTVSNLAGFSVGADRPTGDKTDRADRYSVQVNWGNVFIVPGEWNAKFIDEHRYFPFGTFKDQVDASSGAFKALVGKKKGGMLSGHRR